MSVLSFGFLLEPLLQNQFQALAMTLKQHLTLWSLPTTEIAELDTPENTADGLDPENE